jgi:hypothetical protein
MSNQSRANTSSLIIGGILIVLGFSALLHALNIHLNLPRWFFKWEYIPIIAGLAGGYSKRFGPPFGWAIPILVGLVFLLDDVFVGINAGRLIVPIILLGVGAMVILNALGAKSTVSKGYPNTPIDNGTVTDSASTDAAFASGEETIGTNSTFTSDTSAQEDIAQFLNVRTFMGAVEQTISSQNVTGGDFSVIMGGAELNLINANIQGPITINCMLVMGGLTLIVPSDWRIVNEVTPIMGGVEDRRYNTGNYSSGKVVHLKGTAIMGGIEVKSFR